MRALFHRFYFFSEEEILNLSFRLMNELISQIPYVYEQSEKFAKPPKKEPISKDQEFLKAAKDFGVKVPPKVRYQMGDSGWNGI